MVLFHPFVMGTALAMVNVASAAYLLTAFRRPEYKNDHDRWIMRFDPRLGIHCLLCLAFSANLLYCLATKQIRIM